jgi:hypothetical protein
MCLLLLLATSGWFCMPLDRRDLRVGMLFGLAHGEAQSRARLSAVAPFWDDRQTSLVIACVILWGTSVAFGVFYICRFLRAGPVQCFALSPVAGVSNPTMPAADERLSPGVSHHIAGD